MLSNSVIAGGLAAGYLAVLVLQLNPQYPIDPGTIAPLALMLGAAYGLNLAAVFYALIVAPADSRGGGAVAGLAQRPAALVAVHDRRSGRARP